MQKGKVRLFDVDVPKLDCNSILVNTHYSFISSGTELATISASAKSLFQKASINLNQNVKKVFDSMKENGISSTLNLIYEKSASVIPLGYSCSGKVVAVGSKVENFIVGDYVACAGTTLANHADYVAVPKNLAVKIKNPSLLKQSSLTTIGAIALQGFRRANPMLGEKICIMGLGLIGQLTLQIAKNAGCQVIGVDIKDTRLELAKKMGADFVVNSSKNDWINDIIWLTKRHGVDATIITAASSSGDLIQNSMVITRRKGRVVLVGDVKIDFDRDPFYSKEIDFLISCSYGPGRYDDTYEMQGIDYPYDYVRWTENRNMEFFAELIQNNKIIIDSLLSSEFTLDRIEQAYSSLTTGDALGIILAYNSGQEHFKAQNTDFDPNASDSCTLACKTFKPFLPPEHHLNLGCVGVGGFAKTKLLPILNKIKNISIHSIADTNPATVINVARLYNVQNTANDYNDLLQSDINAVVIATPHFLHTDQAIDFMMAGKAVFVEKPAAVNFEQLNKLENFFKLYKNFFYCIDFNRPFSPFMRDIKNALNSKSNPIMLSYRMNAGWISNDHWINSAQNGGRIIGEACHIFDLFLFLIEAKPISVSVQTINSSTHAIAKTDNFFAQLMMEDGSCCSLFYNALGKNESGKERMEIYFDGKSIIMDDFYELQGFGLPQSFNKISRIQDKGHESLLQKFCASIKSQDFKMPIPTSRVLLATRISLVVDELARHGGGWQEL